jgi:GAF domain-containing protein
LIPCQRVGVVLIDTGAAEAEIAAFDAAIESQIPADVHMPLDELHDVVEQLLQGDTVVFDDISGRGEIFEILYAEGVRSAVFFPLLFGSDLIGALTFWLTEDDTFTPDFRGIARQLADQLAIAIQQARLYEQVQRHAEELERRVAERTAELSRLVDLMAGREVRMAELKDVIEQLHTQLEAAGLTPAADDSLAEWRNEP